MKLEDYNRLKRAIPRAESPEELLLLGNEVKDLVPSVPQRVVLKNTYQRADGKFKKGFLKGEALAEKVHADYANAMQLFFNRIGL